MTWVPQRTFLMFLVHRLTYEIAEINDGRNFILFTIKIMIILDTNHIEACWNIPCIMPWKLICRIT